jgi:site-specific DNA-methyltransferase (adenine-specific)
VAELVAVFREVWRVLADDGTLWLNLGDSYSGSGKGPAGNLGKIHNEREIKQTSGIVPDGLKPKDLIGIPWRVAFALQSDGWYLRQDIIWHKPNPMPESVRDRCTKAHEYIFLLSKSPKYYFDSDAIKEPSVTNDPRRPYTSKGAKDLDGRAEWKSGETRDSGDFSKRNRRSVWTVTTKPFKGAHFATFPPELVRPCILAGCKKGGTVIDPFGGSGTTGQVCEEEGRNSILIELNPAYIELQKQRTAQMGLGL